MSRRSVWRASVVYGSTVVRVILGGEKKNRSRRGKLPPPLVQKEPTSRSSGFSIFYPNRLTSLSLRLRDECYNKTKVVSKRGMISQFVMKCAVTFSHSIISSVLN